ncbi:MAG: hypothetical protein AAGK02_05670 [Pseudomonadota bacterium]
MKQFASSFTLAACLLVAACSGGVDEASTNQADDFAARINGDSGAANTAPKANATPATIAPTREGAAEGAFVAGTATDPEAAICGAPKVGPYIGTKADDAVRQEIVAAVGPENEIRFILPGSTFINPDPTSRRLNVMLDNTGIVRDARCG